MKTKLLFIGILLWSVSMLGQNEINIKFIKFNKDVFIFDGSPEIFNSTETTPDLTHNNYFPPINSTFTILKKVAKTGHMTGDGYIIEFREWSTKGGLFGYGKKENINKALAFNYTDVSANFNAAKLPDPLKNYKLDTETGVRNSPLITAAVKKKAAAANSNKIIVEKRYFFIYEEDLLSNAKKYNPRNKLEFTFGTIAYLIKIRPRIGDDISSKWSTDMAGGITYGPRYNLSQNWGVSLLGGLTLSKVNMDSISTRGFVTKKIVEKIAVTPTLNMLFSYKNFTFGGAIGMDWINDDTLEASSWVYNKKLFWTVGIGFNLFSSGDNQPKTNSSDQ